jgi:hypothetical protein
MPCGGNAGESRSPTCMLQRMMNDMNRSTTLLLIAVALADAA